MGRKVETKQIVILKIKDFLDMIANAPPMLCCNYYLINESGIVHQDHSNRATAFFIEYRDDLHDKIGVIEITDSDSASSEKLEMLCTMNGGIFNAVTSFDDALLTLKSWGILHRKVLL